MYNYNPLRGKIREMFGTESLFSERIGINRATLSKKINNKVPFSQWEIDASCKALKIPTNKIAHYFFSHDVAKPQIKED